MNEVTSNLKLVKYTILSVIAAVVGLIVFNTALFYNEAGYQTHVRTLFGEEKVVDDVGYSTKWFGRATPWKQAQTIQFSLKLVDDVDDAISVSDFKVVFLGNVDSAVEASTRFRLPTGEQFLKIAREYRTPENFLLTAVVPAVKETLQSTASLMTADDYFSGARSEFAAEFESQLKDGQYVIQRKEVTSATVKQSQQKAASTTPGVGLVEEELNTKTQFVTVKVVDKLGQYARKEQQFRNLGVEVVEARITTIVPNIMYLERMKKVQTSLADLAITRQDRLKEEEKKLLVIASGEREVEEKRQLTLKDQIEKTTNADTNKQLAIIEATRDKEKAEIANKTMAIHLETSKLEAAKIKTLADANAYAKKVVLEADGALTQKLETLVSINKEWAAAAAKAPVSQFNMGSGGSNNRQSEISNMMELLTVKAAKDLSTDLNIK